MQYLRKAMLLLLAVTATTRAAAQANLLHQLFGCGRAICR